MLITKTYMAVEYRYCKPEILLDQPKAFVDAKELRHCLIEQIQENESVIEGLIDRIEELESKL